MQITNESYIDRSRRTQEAKRTANAGRSPSLPHLLSPPPIKLRQRPSARSTTLDWMSSLRQFQESIDVRVIQDSSVHHSEPSPTSLVHDLTSLLLPVCGFLPACSFGSPQAIAARELQKQRETVREHAKAAYEFKAQTKGKKAGELKAVVNLKPDVAAGDDKQHSTVKAESENTSVPLTLQVRRRGCLFIPGVLSC